MTTPLPLRLGIGLDAAAHAGSDQADWRDFWSALIARFDGVADFLTVEDGFARAGDDGLDAVLLANWLAPRSHHIGIIAGAPVNFLEPFHLSTGIATLDYVSEGRAGLLVQQPGEGQRAEAARAIGPLQGFPGAQRPELERDAVDSIDVIRGLWDSWEQDAVIRDIGSQRFIDGAKLHYLNFQGAGFKVLGPSITPRPPQGQPVIAANWSIGEGAHLIHHADLVFLRIDQDDVAGAIKEARQTFAAAGPALFVDIDAASIQDPVAGIKAVARQDVEGVRLIVRDIAAAEHLLVAVISPLREAGVIARPATGNLRARLGLPAAQNRYAVAG